MRKTTRLTCLFLILGLLGFAACKGTGDGPSEPGVTSTPKEEATLITDATAEATHVWEQPTSVIKTDITPTATAEVTTEATVAAEDKFVARGKMLYEKRECNSCHGANAEGMPDKGAKLAGTALTEAEFKDLLRTGKQGELGNDHLYGTSAISESGISAVYAFLQSLGE